MIGRRACEVEWDLLELLDPGGGQATSRAPGGAHGADPPLPLHDRPTAGELIDAARGALGDHVLPLLEARPAFELRVSLRALGMVRRELELAPQHAVLRAGALASLGVDDERALAAAIRAGAFDEREGELVTRAPRARAGEARSGEPGLSADLRQRERGNVSEAAPDDVTTLIEEIDAFIAAEIRPLEAEGDNARFFDHRREYARTDFEAGGIPRREWEDLLEEMVTPRR